jgi:hypothetical protein
MFSTESFTPTLLERLGHRVPLAFDKKSMRDRKIRKSNTKSLRSYSLQRTRAHNDDDPGETYLVAPVAFRYASNGQLLAQSAGR